MRAKNKLEVTMDADSLENEYPNETEPRAYWLSMIAAPIAASSATRLDGFCRSYRLTASPKLQS